MKKEKYPLGVLTLSDKGAAGKRFDESGQIAQKLVEAFGEVICYQVIPDDEELIVATLRDWVDHQKLALILTTGGTGLTSRDVTPQATSRVVDYSVPGMAEAMRAYSLTKTPHAMLSRAMVGVRGQCLIINLPGSPKGVRENLETLLPALPHALAKLAGDPEDCAKE